MVAMAGITRHIAADQSERDMAQVDPWDETVERPPPKGIGGWLWLPLLQLIATPIMLVLSALGRLKAHPPAADIHAMAGHPLFLMLAGIIALVMLAQFLLGLFCLVQFLRKKEALPRLMTIWYGVGIALSVLVPIQFALSPELFSTVVDATATPGQAGLRATMNIVIFGIFILYFGISERVKNTFVR
jgi:hypothetical protein